VDRSKFLRGVLLILSAFLVPKKLLANDSFSRVSWKEFWDEASRLEELVPILEALEKGTLKLEIQGSWSLGKVLSHCSQSIQFSMLGYPEMKSVLFRGSAGKMAFSFFAFRNKMSHGLEEPIPGGADLSNDVNVQQAAKNLISDIKLFQSRSKDDLRPHFAYGELSKEEYDLAHTLHIKNHFDRISLVN